MKVSYSFSAICMFLVAVGSCLAVEEQALLNFYNSLGMQPLLPAKSCNEIYTYNFASRGKSGYYWIKISTSTIKVPNCIHVCTYVYTYVVDCMHMCIACI